jgi:hypothetical protein
MVAMMNEETISKPTSQSFEPVSNRLSQNKYVADYEIVSQFGLSPFDYLSPAVPTTGAALR